MAHISVASEQHEANANLQLSNGPSSVYFKYANMQSGSLAACTKRPKWRRAHMLSQQRPQHRSGRRAPLKMHLEALWQVHLP